ncbi:MAG: terminase small subunit [Desulfobulbaceae bacterium]|nr:terminase small subunit [Desulfobulbaceae bacterium]
MKANVKSELTPKQEQFCREYLIDLNGTKAAIRAGYTAKTADATASRLLRNVKVKEYVSVLQQKREQKTGVTAEYVLTTIQETIDRCRQAVPVFDRQGNQVFTETPDGNIVPAYKYDSMAVLKGAELLGKHLALFTDRHELSGADGGPIQHSFNFTVIKTADADQD